MITLYNHKALVLVACQPIAREKKYREVGERACLFDWFIDGTFDCDYEL